MEILKKTEKGPKDIDIIVQDILEKEKSFSDDEDQKIDLLMISFYKTLGDDKLKDMLADDARIFRGARRKLNEMGISEQDENYNDKLQIERQKIVAAFDSGDVVSFIKDIYSNDPDTQDQEDPDDNDKIAGILKYNFDSRKDGEEYVQIHLHKKDFSEGVDGFQFQKSLSLLCDDLVKMKRIPKGLIAKSWLMGVDAIRERAGFDKLSEIPFNPDVHRDMSLWGQFLDNKGNLKPKELKYLFENNKPRYNATEAGISISGLLKKYGDQYLGKELQTINMERVTHEEKRIDDLSEEIKKYFQEVLTESRYNELVDLFSQHPVWKKITTNHFHINVLGYIQQAKHEGVPVADAIQGLHLSDRDILNQEATNIRKEYLNSFVTSTIEKVVIE